MKWNMKLVNSFSFFLFSFLLHPLLLQLHTFYPQNEILEEFDKTSQANGNDSAIEVNDTTVADSICSESPKVPVLKSTDTASLRRRYHGHVTKKTTNSDEEWNSLDQFEKLVKSEMEYLTSQNHQKSNGLANDMSTKINHQPILKPEKHVSLMFHLTTFRRKFIDLIPCCVPCRVDENHIIENIKIYTSEEILNAFLYLTHSHSRSIRAKTTNN